MSGIDEANSGQNKATAWALGIMVLLGCMGCENESVEPEGTAAIKFAMAPCLGPAPGSEAESGVTDASTCRADLDRLTQGGPEDANACLVLEDKTGSVVHRRALRYADGLVKFLDAAPMVVEPGNDAEASIFLFSTALPEDGCSALLPDSGCESDSTCLMRLGPVERTVSGKRETVFDFIQDGEFCVITRGQLPPGALQELCDGADNDCDGVADEVYETLGEACVAGEGPCARQGIFVCLEDGTMGCDGQPGPAADEICDLIDNDCDGRADEMLRCEGCRTANDCIGNAGGPFCIEGGCHSCSPGTSEGCADPTPVCDVLSLRCRGCTEADECVDGLCLDSGRCGRCQPDTPGACPTENPICDLDTLDCRGCSDDGECPGVCVLGRCAQCNPLAGLETGCPSNTPVCGGTDPTCRRCETQSDCALFVGPSTFCVGGACVPCDPIDQEGCSDPDAPVCDETELACRACNGGGECSTGRCLGGRCVGCDPVDSRGCASASARICDAAENVCRGCRSSAECEMVLPGTFCLNETGNAEGRCVECNVTEGGRCDLQGPAPVCRDFACAPCEGDLECTRRAGSESTRIYCASGTCEACRGGSAPAGCTSPLTVCDAMTQRCRGCDNDDECGGATPFCALGTGTRGVCRQCDSARPGDACGGLQPICDDTTGQCRGCIPRDCAEVGGFCLSGRCVDCEPGTNVGCDLSGDSPFCSPDGICRRCDLDAECPQGALCSEGRCSGCRARSGSELLGTRVDEACTTTSPICDGNSCRECLEGECGAGFCVEGACRGCRPEDNVGCPGPDPTAPFCDAADFTCVGCLESGPDFCPNLQRPVCDPQSRSCVGCTADGECQLIDPSRPLCSRGRCGACRLTGPGVSEGCGGAQPYCDGTLTCDGCQEDTHCPEGTVCNFPTDGRCGECTSQRQGIICPDEQPICSDALRCVGCDLDADCRPRVCDFETRQCVECRTDAHCDAGICNSDGQCVECAANRHCPEETPICQSNQTCGPCSASNQCAPLVCSINGASGTCEACDPNTNEGCPTDTFCNQFFQCVDCRDDIHCDGATPICSRDFVCRECRGDNDCEDAERHICGEDAVCVQCLRDVDCPSGLFCGDDNRCTNCESDNDCLPSIPICDATGVCRECESTAECDNGLFCAGIEGVRSCESCDYVAQVGCALGLFCTTDFDCVECSNNSNCGGGQVCTAEHTCVDCETDENCSEGEFCTPDQTCVECVDDSGCTGFEVCSNTGLCVECNSNAECPDALVCRDSVCTNCLADVGDESECGDGLLCSPTDGFRCRRCDPAEQRGCAEGTVCNGEFRCTECGIDTDCAEEEFCSNDFECLECIEDEHCLDGQHCNDDLECVDCLQDSHCLTGACNADGGCAGCTDPAGCLIDIAAFEQRVTAPNSTGQELFGLALALEGNTVLVGAPKATVQSGGSLLTTGAVDVFVRAPSGDWEHRQRITPNPPIDAINFGISIDLDGDLMAVGTFAEFASNTYIFEKNVDGLWTQEASLRPSGSSARSEFGRPVVLRGSRLLVGAEKEQNNSVPTGAAYVFERGDDGAWSEVATLIDAAASRNARFGSSLILDAAGAIVGLTGQSENGLSQSGSVRVYGGRDPSNWGPGQRLVAPEPATNLYFGTSLGLTEETLMVCANGNIGGEPGRGAAFFYSLAADGAWVLQQQVEPANAAGSYNFCQVSALSGTLAAMNAAAADHGVASGTVHLIQEQQNGVWVELGRVKASSGAAHQNFGKAVALEGTQLVVGAYGDKAGTPQNLTGAVFFYDLANIGITNSP